MTKNTITTRIPLSERIGLASIDHDLSLDYLSFLSCHPDLSRTTSEEGRSVSYHLKSGGVVELRHELTGIGQVVVYFTDCPRELYDALKDLQGRVVDAVNRLYAERK